MNNTTELRKELSKVFKNLKSRKITTDEARASVGITNSMINSAMTESNYNKFLGKKTVISFLKTDE